MAKQLLSNLGKRGDSSYTTNGIRRGLDTLQVDIEDSAHLSKYFRVVEFNPVFTAGKNSISFNGSELLADGSEIKVEVLDSAGTSLYLDSPPRTANYTDIANFTVAIHVYQEIADGAGQIFLVGTSTKGEIVRWTGNITINTTYKNVSRTRFFHFPEIEIQPLLLPTVDITTGASLGVNVTVTGSCTGVSIAYNNSSLVNANGPTSNYHVTWTTFSSSVGLVNGFNSQMVGETIVLYVYTAENPTTAHRNSIHRDVINSTQSFKIVQVINPTEIRLDGDVVDTVNTSVEQFVSPSFIGGFSINYVHTSYLNQATSVPVVGAFSSSTHTTTLIANDSFFTASMIGTAIQVNYNTLVLGTSGFTTYSIIPAQSSSVNRIPVTSSIYTVVNVINNYTASISPPVTYTLFNSNDPHIISTTTYTASTVYGSVTSLSASNAYQYYSTAIANSLLLQKSYAKIVYRNLKTFSGFVASQKLYSRSNIFPGEFELISNTPIGPTEHLYDPITVNKNYSDIGIFYNQDQVNQYWYASSPALSLIQSDSPVLSAMTITTNPNYTAADGTNYVIAKVSSINVVNDSNYYPYDELSYRDFLGTGYTSNFIFLQQNVLYAVSANFIINKNSTVPAKVSFYITSSSPEISGEPNFNPIYGLKVGEITINDNVSTKSFPDGKILYFTPMNDYYGTLVIVPYQCNVTMTNLSLTNYGDYGFSPGGAELQTPFPVNVANETFEIKAELYDNNSNLVYTVPSIVQAFDPNGSSLYGTSIVTSVGTGSTTIPTDALDFTVHDNLYLLGLTNLPPQVRFLSYQIPQTIPPLPGAGKVGYTSVSNISLVPTNTNINTIDYLNIELNGTTVGRSLALRYSGSSPNVYGRRVVVDLTGSKTTYM